MAKTRTLKNRFKKKLTKTKMEKHQTFSKNYGIPTKNTDFPPKHEFLNQKKKQKDLDIKKNIRKYILFKIIE